MISKSKILIDKTPDVLDMSQALTSCLNSLTSIMFPQKAKFIFEKIDFSDSFYLLKGIISNYKLMCNSPQHNKKLLLVELFESFFLKEESYSIFGPNEIKNFLNIVENYNSQFCLELEKTKYQLILKKIQAKKFYDILLSINGVENFFSNIGLQLLEKNGYSSENITKYIIYILTYRKLFYYDLNDIIPKISSLSYFEIVEKFNNLLDKYDLIKNGSNSLLIYRNNNFEFIVSDLETLTQNINLKEHFFPASLTKKINSYISEKKQSNGKENENKKDGKKEIQNSEKGDIIISHKEIISPKKSKIKKNQIKKIEQIELELKNTKLVLQKTQTELEDTKSKLEKTTLELGIAKSQLKETESKLENTLVELKNTKSELKNTKSELKNTKSELKNTKSKLEEVQTSMKSYEKEININKIEKIKNDEKFNKINKKLLKYEEEMKKLKSNNQEIEAILEQIRYRDIYKAIVDSLNRLLKIKSLEKYEDRINQIIKLIKNFILVKNPNDRNNICKLMCFLDELSKKIVNGNDNAHIIEIDKIDEANLIKMFPKYENLFNIIFKVDFINLIKLIIKRKKALIDENYSLVFKLDHEIKKITDNDKLFFEYFC